MQGFVAQLPVAPNVERVYGRDQLHYWVAAASAILLWLPLQGTLRHFLKFLPRRIISE